VCANVCRYEADRYPPTEAIRNCEQRPERYADEKMKKADANGIDNVRQTWTAVRRDEAARRGDKFEPREPHPFSSTGNDWLRTPVSRFQNHRLPENRENAPIALSQISLST